MCVQMRTCLFLKYQHLMRSQVGHTEAPVTEELINDAWITSRCYMIILVFAL